MAGSSGTQTDSVEKEMNPTLYESRHEVCLGKTTVAVSVTSRTSNENFTRQLREHSTSLSELDVESGDDARSSPEKAAESPPPMRRFRRAKSLYGVSPNCKFGPKASIAKNQANVLTIQDPGTQRLTWYKKPLTVLVIRKMFDESVIPNFVQLVRWLVKEKQMLVYLEDKSRNDDDLHGNEDFEEVKSKLSTFKEGVDDISDKIDFIICLGGDGTLLYASSLFQHSLPPVMAFHLGSLGFLMPFDFTNFEERINEVLEGNVPITLRTRLKCVICKSNDSMVPSIKNVESRQHIMALNELVVDRGASSYLCNLDLYIERRYVTSVQGDGLIISTPTGSTAYAAAAGASIMHPNVPAICITPVCPHSLSFRPIIVPAGVEVKICLSPNARSSAWVSFDGRQRQEISKDDTIRIGTSIYPLPSICSEDQISDWFESLAGCLHWNVRRQQKSHSDLSALSSESSLMSDTNGSNSSPTNNNTHTKQS